MGALSLCDFFSELSPTKPQGPLKLDSVMSPVAGRFSQEGHLLDLHTECPLAFGRQLVCISVVMRCPVVPVLFSPVAQSCMEER